MSAAKRPEGIFQRGMLALDEHVSVKVLQRVWGPRLEFVVRLMLVATFLDDSFRTATHFSEHTKQVGEQVGLFAVASIALTAGLVAQSLGSLCLLALVQPDNATKALIGWAVAQPVLYGQLTNVEFVAESLSLVGGLLMLRAHLLSEEAKQGAGGDKLCDPDVPNAARVVIARTQLLGRLLLPAVYLYHAGHFLFVATGLNETDGYGMYIASLSMFVVNAAVLVGLAVGSTLVAAGLKSRTVALSLALVNLGYVCYLHPYFKYVWLENNEWQYDEVAMRQSMPHVALGVSSVEGVAVNRVESDFDPWQIYDLHRYYFFLGLSTSGALLLLAQFGPGEIAVQKDETLLPVVGRAQD